MIDHLTWRFKRLQQVMRRSWGSLAMRGWRGTFQRVIQEFRPHQATDRELVEIESTDAPAGVFAIPVSSAPLVSIVIPVEGASIDHALTALHAIARHAGNTPIEVLVIGDAKWIDPLADIAGLILLKIDHATGFGRLCREAVRASRGKFVAFIATGCVPAKGCLEGLLACFEEESDCHLAGARIVGIDRDTQASSVVVDATGQLSASIQDEPWERTRRRVDSLIAGVWMIKREQYERLAATSEGYASSDYYLADIGMAARHAGGATYVAPTALTKRIVPASHRAAGELARDRSRFHIQWLQQQTLPTLLDAEAAGVDTSYRRRILVVDTRLPNPSRDAGSLRLCMMSQILHRDGWRVDLIADDGRTDAADVTRLGDFGITIQAGRVATWLRRHGHELDAVMLSRMSVAAQYLSLSRRLAPQAKHIFDTVDLHFVREQRAADISGSSRLRRQAAASRRLELDLIRKSDLTFVVSETEKDLLAEEVPDCDVALLSTIHTLHGRKTDFAARHDIVFVGGFGHPPNADAMQWFVTRVMPLLRAEEPTLTLHIIGDITAEARAILNSPGVTIHGRIDQLAPFMEQCKASVAPLRFGAGVKGKVNMAMSHGLPVVVSSIAAEGMHLTDEVDALIADEPEAFARAILRLYRDEALWLRLSAGGLRNVQTHFSIDTATRALHAALPRVSTSQNSHIAEPSP